MKTIIIYASIHHGNTYKLVEAIADKYDIETVDATKVTEKDLSDYDLIGFASGIYGFNFHQAILNFASANLPENKDIFFMTTSAMNKDFNESMLKAIADKKANVKGYYHCHGYNTFGPFKIVGGTSKGHPDEKDIAEAVKFYEGLIG